MTSFDAVAALQWAHLTRDQLLTFMTKSQLEDEIRTGRLLRRFLRVYKIAGVPDEWRHGPMAAWLSVGAGAGYGRCAARLLGVPGISGHRIELVVPRPLQPRLPGVIIRRSTYLPEHHLTYLDALPVTNVARLLCDLSARLSAETLRRVMRKAVRFERTTYDEIAAVREDIRAQGRRRTTVIDEILDTVLPRTTPGDSEGEYKLLEWIASAGLPMPKQQFWVVTNGGRFCLDLAYPEEKIDLEWDSELHERTPEDVEYDAARDAELTLAGWFVMRSSRLTTRDDFVRRLEQALRDRAT